MVNMTVRVDSEKAKDTFESVCFISADERRQYNVTLRKGVAEVIEGDPLPGTPQPIAKVTTGSLTFNQMLNKMTGLLTALTEGKIQVEGNVPGLLVFKSCFQNWATVIFILIAALT